jgi:hypothetical protein
MRYLCHDTSFFQRGIGPVFVNRFDCARRELHGHKALQFRNPNALSAQVWLEVAWRHSCDVLTDTALFLRKTAAVNFVAPKRLGSCDVANTAHKFVLENRTMVLKRGAEHADGRQLGQGYSPFFSSRALSRT